MMEENTYVGITLIYDLPDGYSESQIFINNIGCFQLLLHVTPICRGIKSEFKQHLECHYLATSSKTMDFALILVIFYMSHPSTLTHRY